MIWYLMCIPANREIGWAIIEWHGELDGIMQTSVECQHASQSICVRPINHSLSMYIVISDALGYRNGTYTPDNRNVGFPTRR